MNFIGYVSDIQCASFSNFDPDFGSIMARAALHLLGWRQDQRGKRAIRRWQIFHKFSVIHLLNNNVNAIISDKFACENQFWGLKRYYYIFFSVTIKVAHLRKVHRQRLLGHGLVVWQLLLTQNIRCEKKKKDFLSIHWICDRLSNSHLFIRYCLYK